MKKTLVEICNLLNEHEVDYLLIGGLAVVYHGYTRSTNDIDFWYRPTISNFLNIIEAFKKYGIDVSELEEVVFDPDKAFLRFPLSNLNVEFLPIVHNNLSFQEAFKRAEFLKLADTKIPIIGYEDLVKIKTASDRLKVFFVSYNLGNSQGPRYSGEISRLASLFPKNSFF